MDGEALLRVQDLCYRHGTAHTQAPAVDGVSLSIRAGETLGLVGESGCGKTTLARLIAGLLQADSGSVQIAGLQGAPGGTARRMARAHLVQMVFQDPFGSLNPRLRIGTIVGEPLAVHRIGTAASRAATVADLLHKVGLAPGTATRFAHELSGGQRQRVAIARALALRPKLIVCDEPVSALDVSIQAQVLNLLRDLQTEFGLAYLFISHDLRVVRYVADRIAVMYRGRIVETGPSGEIWRSSRHPYSQALIASLPGEPGEIAAEPLSEPATQALLDPHGSGPGGCRFRADCPIAVERCAGEQPELMPAAGAHQVACWRR